jgi:hypothetical protein
MSQHPSHSSHSSHSSQPSHQSQQQAISAKEQTTFLGPLIHVSHKDIAKRAFAIFQARGATHGSDVQDWLCANKELIAERQSS